MRNIVFAIRAKGELPPMYVKFGARIFYGWTLVPLGEATIYREKSEAENMIGSIAPEVRSLFEIVSIGGGK